MAARSSRLAAHAVASGCRPEVDNVSGILTIGIAPERRGLWGPEFDSAGWFMPDPAPPDIDSEPLSGTRSVPERLKLRADFVYVSRGTRVHLPAFSLQA